jgi:predicted nucleic acid-binding protein
LHLLLDSGPLGLITNPLRPPQAQECLDWLDALIDTGAKVYVAEIIDYELRREVLRTQMKTGVLTGLDKLDNTVDLLDYLPLTTAAMRRAAALWARARHQAAPPASDDALDVDIIFTAQALELEAAIGEPALIATTNIKHLSLFADARHWRDIKPETPYQA